MLLPLADWPQCAPKLDIFGLRLRPLRQTDAADWYAYLRDDNVTRHTSWQIDGAQALADLIQDYADPVASHCMRLAIVETNDRLVGTIGFNEIAPGARRAEIAYDLSPSHWRRGIASRACETVTAWAFQTLGLARVQATVLDTNTASAGVLERCHFDREGLLHHYRQVRGEPRHFWMYARIWPPALVGAECG